MITAVFSHKVKDFDVFLKEFKAHEPFRAEQGCKGTEVLQAFDDPNNLTIICKWDSAENFDKFGKSQNLQDRMAKAGVTSEPVVHVFNSAGAFAS